MSSAQLLIFCVLGAALALFAWGRLRYELVAVSALLILVIAGLVPASQAFAGFGHPAVITVAIVLAMSRALERCGAIDAMLRLLTRVPNVQWLQCASLTSVGAVLSAFMNNVGALALMLPVATRLGRRHGIAVSRLLMPLAFGSLLGGLCTLIGTPPNVIIATFRERELGQAFSMFDFTPVGAVVMVVGVVGIVTLAGPLVPRRREKADKSGPSSERFNIELVVADNAHAEDALQAIERAHADIVSVLRDGKKLTSDEAKPLRGGDKVLTRADTDAIEALTGQEGFSVGRTSGNGGDATHMLAQAVVRPASALTGRSAKSFRLLTRTGLSMLAVSREGRHLRSRPAQVRLRAGDVLLLEGEADDFEERIAELGCLPLAGRHPVLVDSNPYLTPVLFLSAIALVSMGVLALPIALASALALVVLLKQIPMREVYDSIDWPVIVLLAAMLPVGEALESSGAAALVAKSLLGLVASWAPELSVAAFILMAMTVSNVVNNAATALLMAPIAIDFAAGIQANPDPFLMAVAVGSSSAFMTPIGHQSNLLVMGPGGYRFSDYWRLGLPVSLLVVTVATPTIVLVFPL